MSLAAALPYILLSAFSFALVEPLNTLPQLNGVNAVTITALRFLISCALLLPYSISTIRRNRLRLSAKDWGILAGLGILFIGLSMNLLQLALQVVRSSGRTPLNTALIFSSNGLFTLLFSVLFLREDFTRRKALAAALSTAGLLLCIDFRGSDGITASLLTLGSAVTFSIYTILTKKFSTKLNGVAQCGLVYLIGSLMLFGVLFAGGTEVFANIGPANLPLLLFMGLFCTGAGYWGYFKSIEKGSTFAASFVFFVKPVLSPFVVWAVRGADYAPKSWKSFIAVAFIVAGAVVASLQKKDRT